jgi:hypothetical protein
VLFGKGGGIVKKTYTRWRLCAGLILVAGSLLGMTPTAASAAPQSPSACGLPSRSGHIAGIVPALGPCPDRTAGAVNRGTAGILASDPAKGTPPLLFHGGSVMMTPSTGPLIVTPIFWNPAGHRMSLAYKLIILKYLFAVTLASGQNSNVFSVLNEYSGANGQISYQVRLGFPINDTAPLPADGCTVASTDTAGIYADNSGYNACLDDAQLQAEIDSVTAARSLPHDLSHIYLLFLPKHVESCFNPGSTTTNANACAINHQPSAAYCAYHSEAPSSAVYANLPYPVYSSGTGFTCGTEKNFGTVESPNRNRDADVEINWTSKEISSAITDPDTNTGWYDSSGFEIGDECAFVFGPTQGTPGRLYNQVISGFRFLTQEEFSNRDFAITGGGCVQSASAEA